MRRLLLILVIVLLAGAGYWWFVLRASATTGRADHAKPDIPVLVAVAAKQDVPIYLDGLGTVQASATVTVKPQVDGTLIDVRFKEGQDVRAGDILARIDPRTYQAALDQAAAKKEQDQANLANARVDLGRYNKLAATAYTSAQQADTQKATVAQLAAQVSQDQAQIDTARAQLSYTTVTSPIDGRLGIRQVDQGNLVHASDTTGIVVVTTLKPIDVVFTLPQQQLAAVAAAMQAGTAEASALPQDLSQRTDRRPLDVGTLAVIDNQVDSTTGTIKLKAQFPNDRLQLWPGAFVTVRLRVRTEQGVTVVPTPAVQRGPDSPFVYVVGPDLTAERRTIHVGHEDMGSSVVLDGVRPGEQVVVDGASRLTDNVKVAIAQPPGAPPAADKGARPHRQHKKAEGAAAS